MKDFKSEKDCWISSSGFLGESFFFKTLDLEIEDNLEIWFESFLKTLSQNVRARISLFQEFSKQCQIQSERAKAISEKGFLKTKGLIHFEHRDKISFREALGADFLKKEEHLTNRLLGIRESKDSNFLGRLKAKPISSSFFKELYSLFKPVEITTLGLKSAEGFLGVLKLKNSGNYPLSLQSLPLALENLPKPIGFHIAIEKMSPVQGKRFCVASPGKRPKDEDK